MSQARRSSVHTSARCVVSAGGDGCIQHRGSTSGPMHTVLHRATRGPDVLLIARDSAGLASGDSCSTVVDVGRGASIVVSDPGPTHLLTSGGAGGEPARQSSTFTVGPDASLVALPHAVVPLPASRSILSTKIQVTSPATAVVGGVLSCGRASRGESWQADYLEQTTEIVVDGELLALDAVRAERDAFSPHGHLVTLFVYRPGVSASVPAARSVGPKEHGISALSDDFVVLRAVVGSYQAARDLLRDVVGTVITDFTTWHWERIGFGGSTAAASRGARSPRAR
jgi:urease accessory protein UreH